MRPLVVIAGPTAVGKSEVSIKLAAKIGGSIISADSMQVYRGMDIGTAKVREEEREGIPHYLIDVLEPQDDFNIVRFKEMADEAIDDIAKCKRIPILVGGTGFYIQSVLYDIDFTPGDEMTDYRQELSRLIEERGSLYVHEMLAKVDPEAAKKIHHNDSRRLIRALEYHKQTGMPISGHNSESSRRTSPYDFCYFVLNDDRQKIYERIDRRVDRMIEAGLVREVKSLMDKGLDKNFVSMHGLGYKEIIDHLEGKITLDEAVYIIKRDTRHFAKRQLTWFKREKDVIWIDINDEKDIVDVMLEHLSRKGIINE
ncbi:MAG: tRNA (adenosine(37)-N6)-dimethylallyltransferase MiaA [Lachnospiraceae bacterium]|nr:tRNA (adenosine(37)-N6)-dimethylallyltransferase MiaA [Lachnospiraceae bacterium]